MQSSNSKMSEVLASAEETPLIAVDEVDAVEAIEKEQSKTKSYGSTRLLLFPLISSLSARFRKPHHAPQKLTFVPERNVTLELFFKIRSLRRQHSLAHEHFENLASISFSYPLILLSLVSGILAFLVSASDGENQTFEIPGTNGTLFTPHYANCDDDVPMFSERQRQVMAIIVGAISFVQITFQKLGEYYNYGPRSEMHLEASNSLDRLLDKIEFEHKQTLEFDKKVMLEKRADNIARYQEVFEQCLLSCSSPLPLRIRQAFKLLESEFMLYLMNQEKMVGNENKLGLYYSHVFNDLFHEMANSFLFPYRLMPPAKAVERVIKRFDDKFMNTDDGYNINKIF